MLKFGLLCLVCSLARICAETVSNNNNDADVQCPPPTVSHGRLVLSRAVYRPGDSARVVCPEGYQLDGPDQLTCEADGSWRSDDHPDPHRLPQCTEVSCAEPAELEAGRWEVEGQRAAGGTRFKHGAMVIYRCDDEYELRTAGGAEQRTVQQVCINGHWLGEEPVCARTGCGPPPTASQGFYLELLGDGSAVLPRRDQYPVGARAVYRCNPAHVLVGTETYQCMRSGEWSPPVAPGCRAEQSDEPLPEPACGLPERRPLTTQRLVRGWLSDTGASAGAVVEYACVEGTRDRVTPCMPQRLSCYGGGWVGRRPHCQPVAECSRPPAVFHGQAYGDGRAPGAEVFYTCEPGYRLLGPDRLTCDAGGCWSPPRMAPACELQPPAAAAEPPPLLSPIGVTLLAVTVAVVLLLVLLLALLLQRRAWKPLRRPPPTPPPPGPGRTEDQDRVALIAYQEGSQQFVLPTYEEAVRSERAPPTLSDHSAGPGAQLAARLHHHHHRSLPPAARRERLWRREQESDSLSQRSVQSHHSGSRQSARDNVSNATPSLLDSMGSTDTMTTSDAASSTLSAAATASVRGMCGSLASFDTSSVLNTEGVPLLEENETELEGAEQDDSVSCGKSSSGDAASTK